MAPLNKGDTRGRRGQGNDLCAKRERDNDCGRCFVQLLTGVLPQGKSDLNTLATDLAEK